MAFGIIWQLSHSHAQSQWSHKYCNKSYRPSVAHFDPFWDQHFGSPRLALSLLRCIVWCLTRWDGMQTDPEKSKWPAQRKERGRERETCQNSLRGKHVYSWNFMFGFNMYLDSWEELVIEMCFAAVCICPFLPPMLFRHNGVLCGTGRSSSFIRITRRGGIEATLPSKGGNKAGH